MGARSIERELVAVASQQDPVAVYPRDLAVASQQGRGHCQACQMGTLKTVVFQNLLSRSGRGGTPPHPAS
jgi:hypothetical protein